MGMHRNVSLLNTFCLLAEFKPSAPISVIYYTEVAGSFSMGMLVFSIASLAASAFEVPTGILSDLLGRKETVLVGSVCSMIGLLLYALATDFSFLALGSVFLGAGRSCFSGNNEALLFDSLKDSGDEGRFPTFLGQMNARLQIGLALSAILGGVLAMHSMSLAVWASIPSQFGCLIVALALVNPRRSEKESSWVLLKKAIKGFRENRRLQIISISSSFHYALDESLYLFSPAFISSLWPVWGNGVARLLVHLFGTISFLKAGEVIEKLSPLPALVITNLISRLVGICAVAIPSLLSPLLLCSTSLLYGVSTTAQQTLLHNEFTDAQRATMGSLNSFLGSIIFALLGYGMGMIADLTSSSTALLIGEVALLLTTSFVTRIRGAAHRRV